MFSPSPDDLERRKHVRLRLRPDLERAVHTYEGKTHYVLKDPASLRYYRFDEHDHFLLTLLDGTHTLEDVRLAFEAQFKPRRLSLEDLEVFCQNLLQSGLAFHDLPQAGQQLYEQRQKRRLSEWMQRLTNILYIEIPLFDPDVILRRLLAWFGWLLRPWFLVAGMLCMAAALVLVATHFETFRAKLPSYQEFFSFQNMVYLWLALGAVKIFHEFSHGLACKVFGGEVHDMGALLLCLMPCLYLNVSDAWTFREKSKRIIVGLAGIYAELVIASLAAFVWWNAPGHTPLQNLCLSVMVVCSVNTLMFNGNPLLRFDGYYVLADWLEIPNLRERANESLKRLFMNKCLGIETLPEPPMTLGRRVLFAGYAIASYVYSWVVTFGVIWTMSRFLPAKLEKLSALLACFALASMVGWPLYRIGKNIYKRGKLPTMEPIRVWATVAVVAVLLLAFFLVPLPVSRIRQTGLVQPRPEEAQKVFVQLSGTLDRLHVSDGQWVEKDDILAEFRSLELEGQLEEARTQHAIRVVQVAALGQQAAETTEPQERARIEISRAHADGERKTFAKEVAFHERTLKKLVLRAPRSGVVMGSPRPEEVGKLWEKDQTMAFCSIGDPSRLRVLVPVSPAEQRLLREDLGANPRLTVSVRVQGWDTHTWEGKVGTLPESEAQEVPAALTARAGGPLAIKPGSRPNSFVPQSQQYLVPIDLIRAEKDGIWPGTLAQVKVHCRWRTAAWWAWQTISSALDLGIAG